MPYKDPKSPAAVAARQRYRSSDKGRASLEARSSTPEAKARKTASQSKYGQSEKGKACRARAQRNYYLKAENKFIKSYRLRLRHALKGRLRDDHALDLLGCTCAEARLYIEAQFQPGMT